VIESFDDKYITMRFSNTVKKFAAYTPVFLSLVSGDDEVLTHLREIVEAAQTEEKKRAEENKRVRAEAKNVPVEKPADTEAKPVVNNGSAKNIGVSVVYCDGGKNNERLGFNGICSDYVIEHNTDADDGRWCSDPDCHCNIYMTEKSKATRIALERLMEDDGFVCHESRLLRDWLVLADTEDDRTPRRLDTGAGKLCVLTTIESGSDESSRCIFAIYMIESVDEDVNGISQLWAESYYRYAFAPEIASQLCFWDFVETEEDEPGWGKDKFRYLDDAVCVSILEKAIELTGENTLKGMLDYFKELNPGVKED
jgi:hypothetical protein